MIVNEIIKFIPESKIEYINRDEDPRDYRVDFTKIYSELNFKITKRVPDGINEIIQVINDKIISKPDSQRYRNT